MVYFRHSVMFRTFLFGVLISTFFSAKAQDSLLIQTLLQRIASSLNIGNDSFTNHNFPSYISNTPFFKTKEKDDNIFFAALINYLLHQPAVSLSPNNLLLADSIQHQTANLYAHFQNKSGRLTYNFWRTDTAFDFRYTKWIRKLKKNTSLPDDMDDTVLSLIAQNADSARAAAAHDAMQAFINKNDRRSKTIEKNYRSYGAYSVWYGKNFSPVFDVCVLCNILSFVEQYHLHWTAADSASLRVIVQSIKSKDFINKPLYVSPYYGNTSLILYHVAKLMSYGKIPELYQLKTDLIVAAAQQLQRTNDKLEKVILSSVIYKLGYRSPALSFSLDDETISEIEKSDFAFFTGNIPSYFPLFYKHLFTRKKWLLFYHYCPAFNDALLIENLMLKQNSQQ